MVEMIEIFKQIDKENFIHLFKKTISNRLFWLCKAYDVDNIHECVRFESSKQRTQSETKMIGPILENAFINVLYEIYKDSDIKIDRMGGHGFDFKINDNPIEIKTSQVSSSVGFTGNKTSIFALKSDIHVLIKYSIKYNDIDKIYLAIVDTNQTVSKWKTDTSTRSSYSNLKFLIEDLDKIYLIIGQLIPKRKYLYEVAETI